MGDTPILTRHLSCASEAGVGRNVLLIDFEDSFVHTLANYLRQTGATVTTVRHTQAENALKGLPTLPDLAVLSPGPGRPSDFQLSAQIQRLVDRKIPIFGVCLGLQGITEHFGGSLAQLAYPMHGKPSAVVVSAAAQSSASVVFKGVPNRFSVARYHSLHAKRPLPDCLIETAMLVAHDKDGINEGVTKAVADAPSNGDIDHLTSPLVMGIQHRVLPIAAVQFHPESILTSPDIGLQILANAFKLDGTYD